MCVYIKKEEGLLRTFHVVVTDHKIGAQTIFFGMEYEHTVAKLIKLGISTKNVNKQLTLEMKCKQTTVHKIQTIS